MVQVLVDGSSEAHRGSFLSPGTCQGSHSHCFLLPDGMTVGDFVGSAVAGKIGNKIGRRKALMLNCCLSVGGSAIVRLS